MARQIRKRDVIVVLLTGWTLFVLLVYPALRNARNKAKRISCVSFCKQMGLSFRIYANDNNNLYPMAVPVDEGGAEEDMLNGRMFRAFQVMSNELSVPVVVVCPSDTRRPADDFLSMGNTDVSYFVGIHAEDTRPQMILTGDRNLEIEDEWLSGVVDLGTNSPLNWKPEIHQNSGNVGLADGSVQQVTTHMLRLQLKHSGDTTNRVVFPQ
jgi:prepilin-type processing-associated H-X9-DG protein